MSKAWSSRNSPAFSNSTLHGAEKVGTTLTTDDTAWARKELAGLAKAMTGVRDELVNNLAKLSDVDDQKSEVERHQKITETNDTEIQKDIRDRIRKLESDLSDIERKTGEARALHTNRAALRSQINRIRETFRRLLHQDTTLTERIRTLFRGNLDTCACAHRWCVRRAVAGPKPSGKDGVKEWIKKPLGMHWLI